MGIQGDAVGCAGQTLDGDAIGLPAGLQFHVSCLLGTVVEHFADADLAQLHTERHVQVGQADRTVLLWRGLGAGRLVDDDPRSDQGVDAQLQPEQAAGPPGEFGRLDRHPRGAAIPHQLPCLPVAAQTALEIG